MTIKFNEDPTIDKLCHYVYCEDGLLPDGDICPKCGELRAPSGVGGGTWVHVGTAPDRVVLAEYSFGKCVRKVLANGVVIRPKE
jgi:hypothetical protein